MEYWNIVRSFIILFSDRTKSHVHRTLTYINFIIAFEPMECWSNGVLDIVESQAIINTPVLHRSKFKRTVFLIIDQLIKKSRVFVQALFKDTFE